MRQIIYFPGSETVPGYPLLDVTEKEIAAANINGLRHWPGLFDWDVSGGYILDRITDQKIATIGNVNPSTKFTTMSNGKKGYSVSSANDALSMPLVTTGSFTIGVVCGKDLAFGSASITESTTSNPTSWGLYSDFGGSGSIVLNVGDVGLQASVSALWAKKLSDAALTAVVFMFDRVSGSASIRYDGIEMWKTTSASLKTMSLAAEVFLGAVRVAGPSAALAFRGVKTNAFVAVERALIGSELASLEGMLIEAASA